MPRGIKSQLCADIRLSLRGYLRSVESVLCDDGLASGGIHWGAGGGVRLFGLISGRRCRIRRGTLFTFRRGSAVAAGLRGAGGLGPAGLVLPRAAWAGHFPGAVRRGGPCACADPRGHERRVARAAPPRSHGPLAAWGGAERGRFPGVAPTVGRGLIARVYRVSSCAMSCALERRSAAVIISRGLRGCSAFRCGCSTAGSVWVKWSGWPVR